MKTVYVKPTDTCNLDCDHCFTSGSKGAKTAWDVPNVTRWLSELHQQYPNEHIHIELHGGEPFLRPIEEHWQLAEGLRRNLGDEYDDAISIGATTNLIYKLTDKHIEFITGPMGSRIGTSWDPVYRFKNDRMYELWLNNLELLKALDVTIKLFVTATDQLLDKSPEHWLALWETFGVDEIAVERLTSDGNAVDNPHIFPDNRRVDRFYYDLYFAYKAGNWSYSISTLEAIEEKFETNEFHVDTNCRTCEQHLFTIDGEGRLGGCANGARVESSGSIDDNLDEWLYSDGRMARITKEMDYHPNCLSCHLFDVCGGDCHRLVWQGDSCPGLRELLSYFKYGHPETQTIPAVNL